MLRLLSINNLVTFLFRLILRLMQKVILYRTIKSQIIKCTYNSEKHYTIHKFFELNKCIGLMKARTYNGGHAHVEKKYVS